MSPLNLKKENGDIISFFYDQDLTKKLVCVFFTKWGSKGSNGGKP